MDPVVKRLAHFIPPNLITYLACFAGISVVPLLYYGKEFAAVSVLLLSGYLDTLDGTLARYRGISSQKGTLLDIVFDRIVEFSVVLGLFAISPLDRGWYALMMLGSTLICVTCFLVIGIFVENSSHKGFYYSKGLIERTEAFIFFMGMILFPAYVEELACLFTFSVFLTSFLHVYQFNKQVEKIASNEQHSLIHRE